MEVLKRTMALGALALAVAWLAAPGVARSQAEESQILAAFLYNFAKFVEWPDAALSEGESIRIGVLGGEGFASTLEKVVAGKQVRGRGIDVQRLSSPTPKVHVLYVPAGQAGLRDGARSAVAGAPVLTVADAPDFASEGGMVAFVREGNKVRFEINQAAASGAKLRISSRLLGLARKVH